jgi:Hemerythrin HHE cation binding domain
MQIKNKDSTGEVIGHIPPRIPLVSSPTAETPFLAVKGLSVLGFRRAENANWNLHLGVIFCIHLYKDVTDSQHRHGLEGPMQVRAQRVFAGNRRVDVRDMAIVHQVYRREFALAPQVLRDLRPEEDQRRSAAAEWFAVMLLSMRHHHTAEDALLYPLLQGRVGKDLLDDMAQQHQWVEHALATVQARLGEWEQDGAGAAEALALSYEALTAVLIPHLDDEERDIVPLIGDHLTAEEYGRMATSGNGRLDPRILMMAFGAMIAQRAGPDAEFMLSHLPADVRAAWDEQGAADYGEWMRLLRGGLQPAPPAAT